MTSLYHSNSIFWIDIQKIRPNPFQPRRKFDEFALRELADSIRQYGVLQPLVVTRKEEEREDGGLSVFYELIAGERRLRAARMAGLEQVPVIIRNETDDNLRLELAIIENLQREDLNPIDRALAFEQLHKQFNLTHTEIGKKMGKSRVYVSNTLRLLSLPEEMKQGLISGKISEGHTRPLLMLSDRPEEQERLYKEIILKRLSVRDAEKIARKIAQDRVRKKKFVVDPRIREYEKKLSENLGTRVQIEPKEKGGKILIDYFSVEDLEKILSFFQKIDPEEKEDLMERFIRTHGIEISSIGENKNEELNEDEQSSSFSNNFDKDFSYHNSNEEKEHDLSSRGVNNFLEIGDRKEMNFDGKEISEGTFDLENSPEKFYDSNQFNFEKEEENLFLEGKKFVKEDSKGYSSLYKDKEDEIFENEYKEYELGRNDNFSPSFKEGERVFNEDGYIMREKLIYTKMDELKENMIPYREEYENQEFSTYRNSLSQTGYAENEDYVEDEDLNPSSHSFDIGSLKNKQKKQNFFRKFLGY